MEGRFRELSSLDHSGMQPDLGLQLMRNSKSLRGSVEESMMAMELTKASCLWAKKDEMLREPRRVRYVEQVTGTGLANLGWYEGFWSVPSQASAALSW